MYKLGLIFLLLIAKFSFGQDKIKGFYNAYVDSIEYYLDVDKVKAEEFLNFIPLPIEYSITKGLGNFYYHKAFLEFDNDNIVKSHQSYILANIMQKRKAILK